MIALYAVLPTHTTSFASAISANNLSLQTRISSVVGARLSGGQHFTAFVKYAFAYETPIFLSDCKKYSPLLSPLNGILVLSHPRFPGASPTKKSPRERFPKPVVMCERDFVRKKHLLHFTAVFGRCKQSKQ